MPSNAARRALIGALVAGLAYLLARLVARHWKGLLALFAILMLIGRCSGESSRVTSAAQTAAGSVASKLVAAGRTPIDTGASGYGR